MNFKMVKSEIVMLIKRNKTDVADVNVIVY
jgi:hypothetical protein